MNQSCENSRRSFLLLTGATGICLANPGLLSGQQPAPAPAAATPAAPKPPQLRPELVNEFVRVGHSDLPRVQEILAQEPGVLNATWDWGGGDWETALGGAGHMGRKDIAEFLISQGARMDIFVAAMLGQIEIVKSMLAAYPPLLQSRGPHGITLMAHAKKGGSEAMVALLQERGLS